MSPSIGNHSLVRGQVNFVPPIPLPKRRKGLVATSKPKLPKLPKLPVKEDLTFKEMTEVFGDFDQKCGVPKLLDPDDEAELYLLKEKFFNGNHSPSLEKNSTNLT